MTPARLAAVRVLIAVEAGRTTLAAEIERERPDLPDRRDQALFLELAAGVTRWRAELDARISAYSARPVRDLEPEVLAVLRAAGYQLHHLERIPEHALVHESVEIVRALRRERAAGFVNAVLRNMVRGRQRPAPLPARPADLSDTEAALNYLAVTLSHPRWLVARWLDRVGFDACEHWCRFNNASPEITVRPFDRGTNDLPRELEREGLTGVPSRFVPGATKLQPGSLGRLSASTRQQLLIQDEGSQLVAALAGARPGELVLDACASPGGKTLMLLAAVEPGGTVIGADVRPARVALLRSTLERAGRPGRVLTLNAEQPLPFDAVFDRVLLDAPCSGLGTLRRDPDIKWYRQPDDLPRLAASQLRMIEHAAQVVRPGGALVYATCSSEPEENDAVVDQFLARVPGFSLGRLGSSQALPEAETMIDARGMLHSSPAQGLDAFFAALLVRRKGA
jgi:16S rRNA (cytosine967-C5)-methyltransferase